MAQTARTFDALVTLLANNSTGAISAQDLRDMLESLNAPMGELDYFNLTGTAVTIAAQSDGSTNMVKANPVSALTSGGYLFDNGGANDGRLRYTGAGTKMFHTALSVSFSGAANNQVYVLGVAKNGTVMSSCKILRKVGTSGDVGSTALHCMLSLDQNDYIELYVGNTSGTANFTINTLNIFAMGMMPQS